jgi:tetratricopeptide (TPR) repeat protein
MGNKEKKIFLFFLFIFFGFCALFAARKISDPDFWWHLKTGEWIWQHKAIPYVDSFSYTFKGAEWINYEWLFHAIIYPLYKLSGFGGLIIFVIICVLLTFLILFFACREVDGGNRWLSITILFITLLVARGRFAVRPQIISSLLLAFYLYLLILHREERITTRQLILFLIPANILWVNVHGSFLVGIFLVGAYALGKFVPLALSHRRDLKPVFQDRKLQGLLLVCLILLMTSLLNPYTYRIFSIPLKTAGSETLPGITEWIPVDIKSLGVFAIDYTMWFRVLFLIGALSFLIWWDNLKRVENVVIFAFFSYMAFKHIRFGADFALVAAPLIVNNLNHLQWRMRKWRWVRLLPLLIVIACSVNDVRVINRAKRFGFGVWSNYDPKATVEFLKDHDVRGRIFNAYNFGGYMIWHLWPDIPVFIDGRTPTVYSDDFFWLFRQGLENEKMWKRLVDEYAIDIVLIDDTRDTGYSSFVKQLDDDPSWSIVAFDDVSVLYLKDKPKFKEIIKLYKFKYFRPGDISLGYGSNKDYLQNFIPELRLIEARYPGNFHIYHSLGLAYFSLDEPGHLEKAAEYFKKAIAINPDNEFGHFNLGITLSKLKRYEEAITEYEKATAYPNAYYYMGICYYEKGDFYRAIKLLTKYKKILGENTMQDAYEHLGLSYLKTFQLNKAASCFLRASYLSEPSFQINRNLGFTYFGLKDYEKARQYFQEALNLKPNDIKTLYDLGACYEKLGRSREALGFFKRVTDFTVQTKEEKDLIERAKRKLGK